MAKAAATTKKAVKRRRERKVVEKGTVHIRSSFNNTMAAKMFTIAGPVIVYGTLASVVYGLVYWLTKIL